MITLLLFAVAKGYDSRCDASMNELQSWFNVKTGLWSSTGWWNSANCLNGVVDYLKASKFSNATLMSTIDTVYKAHPSYLNNYYDDEGWWALAWLNSFELTNNQAFLQLAQHIFDDMAGGWDNVCSGGIWWSKDRTYKNAIANELFLAVASRLYSHTGNATHLAWAQREWNWFAGSGMINSQHTINDGLNISPDGSCVNNGQTTWSYNQGVVLSGLIDLSNAVNDPALIATAQSIANAAILALSKNGILTESCEPNCGSDGPQFKGIFMRNLFALNRVVGSSNYTTYLAVNANSIWRSARNPTSNALGLMWLGPFDSADAARQSSAQDCLNSVCFE